MDSKVKDIITDLDQISAFAMEIDPRKEGKLVQEIVLALKSTMREKQLKSLSAPQIGYNRRIFCMCFGDNDYRTFINPMIENNTVFQLSRETCSSIPGKTFIRPRFGSITVFYVTPLGKIESRKIVGRAAIVFQHCLDHLNGLTLADIGLEIDDMFDNATEDERAEVIKMYMDSLDIKQKQLEKQMREAAKSLDFELAAELRDTILELKAELEV